MAYGSTHSVGLALNVKVTSFHGDLASARNYECSNKPDENEAREQCNW
jgi:hypothetical protein